MKRRLILNSSPLFIRHGDRTNNFFRRIIGKLQKKVLALDVTSFYWQLIFGILEHVEKGV